MVLSVPKSCCVPKPADTWSCVFIYLFTKQPPIKNMWYLFEPTLPTNATFCCECNGFQTYDNFYTNASKPNGYDTICKVCSNYTRRLRHQLRKIHPAPSDNICDFCGRYAATLHLDHSHETDLHRGWSCLKCNRTRRQYTARYNRTWHKPE